MIAGYCHTRVPGTTSSRNSCPDRDWVRSYSRCPYGHLRGKKTGTQAAQATAMSKTSKRSRGVVDRSATTDVVTQLECAIKNPHAALIGALIGGLVPWFGRTLAHDQVPAAWSAGNTPLVLTMIAVVLGCALFSALSVYKFGRAAFGDSRKALGFVLALEGVMLVTTGATSTVALAVLILINAVANGSVIALSRDATCRQRNADVRRAATRARTQAQHPVAAAVTAPRPARAPRAAQTPRAAIVAPVWRRATLDDVIDAEIISEERLPS